MLYATRRRKASPKVSSLGDKREEKLIQEKLAKRLNGKMEVTCPVGRIDVLTTTKIIEVKRVGGWKSALGQVLAYGVFYPNHQKAIHLFGKRDEKTEEIIRTACSACGVVVTFER